jgi:hypothetical protein
MSGLIYALCMVTAGLCSALLLKSYVRSHYRLLLWSGICFALLSLSNLLLVIDKMMVPTVDLSLVRSGTALIAMTILLYGLIFSAE